MTSVRDYGAHPDEDPEDNVEAFQEAIDHACDHGGRLHIPAGTYHLNNGIIIRDVLRLTGDGAGKSRLVFSHAGPYGVKIAPRCAGKFSSFSDFAVEADAADAGMLVHITGSDCMYNWEMSRIFTKGLNSGLRMSNRDGTTGGIFSCAVRRSWIENGLHMYDVGDSVTIEQNTIHGNNMGIIVHQEGAHVTGARQLVIRNNNITHLKECVMLVGAKGVLVEGNWMETPSYKGNFTGPTGSMLYMGNCYNTRVYRNTIQPLDEQPNFIGADWSIKLAGSTSDTMIDDNFIADGKVGHIQIFAATVARTRVGARNTYSETKVIQNSGTSTVFE
jgi:hypothetical protein